MYPYCFLSFSQFHIFSREHKSSPPSKNGPPLSWKILEFSSPLSRTSHDPDREAPNNKFPSSFRKPNVVFYTFQILFDILFKFICNFRCLINLCEINLASSFKFLFDCINHIFCMKTLFIQFLTCIRHHTHEDLSMI